jgi:hypothetical protein
MPIGRNGIARVKGARVPNTKNGAAQAAGLSPTQAKQMLRVANVPASAISKLRRPPRAESIASRLRRETPCGRRLGVAAFHRQPPAVLGTITRSLTGRMFANPQRAMVGDRGTARIFPEYTADETITGPIMKEVSARYATERKITLARRRTDQSTLLSLGHCPPIRFSCDL